jgi:hypothetical protein
VLEARRGLAERLLEAAQLSLRPSGPRRVVLDDADGRVEAVVQRRMALERRVGAQRRP